MLKQAKAKAREAAQPDSGGGDRGHGKPGAEDRAQSVLESSRQIWLAGLGAFSRAQAGGRKVFDGLVHQGEALEKETRSMAASTASAAREAAMGSAARVQSLAGDTWDKLEKVFEDRVARALSRLGVHSQQDVEALSARVDALAAAVNELVRASGGKPAAKPGKRAAVRRTTTARRGAGASVPKSATATPARKPARKAAKKSAG